MPGLIRSPKSDSDRSPFRSFLSVACNHSVCEPAWIGLSTNNLLPSNIVHLRSLVVSVWEPRDQILHKVGSISGKLFVIDSNSLPLLEKYWQHGLLVFEYRIIDC